jgi:tetratricopeptide (TPR) repeat protein
MEDALPRLIAKDGPDDFQVLLVTNNLAICYSRLDREVDSVALREPAYRRALRAFGPVNGLTQSLMQGLSVGLTNVNRPEGAAKLLEEALPALRKELGPAHPRIGPHVINLSAAYTELGKYRAAVKVLEETIAAIPAGERVAYINLEFLLNNLADAYWHLGDLPNARRVLVDQERYVRSRNPAESLQLASGLVLLGRALLDANLFAEAERVLREALVIREAKEPDGWRVIIAKAGVGIALHGQKRYSEAEPLLIAGYAGLKARRQDLSPVGKDTLELTGRKLALLYERTGRPEKATAVRAELPPEKIPLRKTMKSWPVW